MKHTFFTLALLIFSFINVFAYDFTAICETGQKLAYTINEDKETVRVYGTSQYPSKLIIPYSVVYKSKTYKVTSIGDSAFYNYEAFESVTIPEGVTSIGRMAFSGCSRLTSVTLPENLDVSKAGISFKQDSISYTVLNGKEVQIGQFVNHFGQIVENSYSGDFVIPSKVTAGNTFSVTSIKVCTFFNCRGLTSVTIPEGVTSIGEGSFYGCSALTSVSIPNSVTSIGKSAFNGCNGLTSITIPEGVTSIGSSAFYECSGLTSVIIPESVTSIGSSAFYECSGLTSVTIPEGVTSIGELAFGGCSGLTSITIPEGVTSIGEGAFCRCTGLTSVTIPEGVTSIGKSAFADCSSLTSVIIPRGVTSIGEYAFCRCSGLTSITIPEGVTSIGRMAFSGCNYIETIYFNAVSCKETSEFSNKENITEVIFGDKVQTIPENLFLGCTGLNSVNLSQSVVSIGGSAFSGCIGLTSIIIPQSVTTIGVGAFKDCTKLKELTIGSNCNSIGSNAFAGCSRLIDITCYAEDVPLADYTAFANYNGYLYVPCEYVRWYKADNIFGRFKNLECMPSKEAELLVDDVVVDADINEAEFTMPKNENAHSYILTISNNGDVLCTLTFNENGQLANIDFSTKATAVQGFQFTVTGLSTATDYNYLFKALNANNSVLKEYTGAFKTKNADGTGGGSSSGGEQGSEGGDGGEQGGSTAVSEISNATAVTIVNGQILVNGEAPAFVVTVSGQKITNKNLKSGVYFVVVDGETVKVVVN